MPISQFCTKTTTFLKQTTIYVLGMIGLAIHPNFVQAHPAECVNETAHAVFLPAPGIVCLQKIKVTDNSGTQYYKASLKWQGIASPNQFELATVDIDSSSDENTPSFLLEQGLLDLPMVEIPEAYGTNRYQVELVLKQDNGMNLFEITSAAPYINPDYVAGDTWKPYAQLDNREREAINTLGKSLPYTHLANAVYDFNETAINDWELVEQTSTDSGMQAGVYINSITNQLLIAFRGTEACDFSCSFKELKESVLDLAADTLLSFGESGPQFRHAFNFAEDVIQRYPDYDIKVTGHSLGGGLAQAIGSTFDLETFAFNSAPVPKDYFTEHPTDLTEDELIEKIHVISDLFDPVSHADESGDSYLNAAHVASLIQFNFEEKEVLPISDLDSLEQLYTLRFDSHSMTNFITSTTDLLHIYANGW